MLTKKSIILGILDAYDILKMDYNEYLIYYNDKIHIPLQTDIYSVTSSQNDMVASILRHVVLYSGLHDEDIHYRSHFIKDYQ